MPAERDSARLCGETDVRIAILQTSGANAGEHAVTFIKQARNQMRRYDNDSAARARGTFTMVTWGAILQEWERNQYNPLYVVVPADSDLAHTQQMTNAQEREQFMQRMRELISEGVTDRRERRQIYLAEIATARTTGLDGEQRSPTQHINA